MGKVLLQGYKDYVLSNDGMIISSRERGVQMGDVRAFNLSPTVIAEDIGLFYAEREFRSIFHPLRAPKIWWRRLPIGFSL